MLTDLECPQDHPFAYYNGEYCCQYEEEKVYAPQGEQCNGKDFNRTSLCCKDDAYVNCPGGEDCYSYVEGGCMGT